MIELAVVATRDRDLYEQVQMELVLPDGGDALCKHIGPRVKTVADLRRRAKSAELLVIDAAAPSDQESTDGESGKAVLQFLRELREEQSRIPVIVLLPHRMDAIEAHCANSVLDYELNVDNVGYDAFKVALRRLGVLANGKEAHDYAIEIEVQSRICNVELLEDGKRHRAKTSFNPNPGRIPMYADDFRKWKMLQKVEEGGRTCMRPSPNWLSYFKTVGDVLYGDLLRATISDDLETIQRTPDGLLRTYVRFQVTNELFAVPFEALYDSNACRFLCVVSPIVRRLARESPVRAANGEPTDSGDLNVLFIKAQVEGKWKLVDDADRSVREEEWFEPLSNLDAEEKFFRGIDGKPRRNGQIAVKFFVQPSYERSFAEALENELRERRYEFVHFAGHSFTTSEGRTFLILPSGRLDRVIGLPIESFARWAGGAGVRFAYLSSCRGGSWEGVRNMVEHGVPQVLGFRWDVEDDKAARFAEIFYGRLLDGDESFAAAYRDACVQLHDESNSTNPIWASPVMIIQSDDWWRRAA